MSPMQRLAAVAGMTEGQAYTMAIGLVLALTTAAIGIPPTLRDRVVPLAQSRSEAAAPAGTEGGASLRDEQPAVPDTPGAPGVPTLSSPAVGGGTSAGPAPTFGYDAGRSTAAEGGSLGDVSVVGSVTGSPHGIAVDPETGAFFVATTEGSVVRFAASGLQDDTFDVPGAPTGLLLEGDRLTVLDGPGGKVLELDVATGAHRTIATVPAAGLAGQAPMLDSVVRAPGGDLLVTDAAQGVLWRVGAGGEVDEWYRGPELLSAEGAGPVGMSVDPDGNVIVAVSRSVLAVTGSVHRIAVGSDGAAGASEELYRSLPDVTLAGVTVGRSGRIYVAASGTNGLLVLESDGTEVATVAGDAFDGPVGVAFRGDAVLVVNRGGTVLRAPVEDRARR